MRSSGRLKWSSTERAAIRAAVTNLPVGPSTKRGVTHDPDFEAWANNSSKPESKRNLIIDVFNEAGQKMASYKVHRAWVSDFTGAADLDANANAIMIQSIKIQHEGYERDNSVKEPP